MKLKVHRSPNFNPANPKIWEGQTFDLDSGKGKTFIMRALLSGFDVSTAIKIGPFQLKQYEDAIYADLGSSKGKKCILELVFDDRAVSPPQETPVSMYVEPYWLFHSFFIAMQLLNDSWVGMGMVHYYSVPENKLVGTYGSPATSTADDYWSSNKQPTVENIDPDQLLELIAKQQGNTEMAIDRYSLALGSVMEDALIDFVIVLDGLLGYKTHEELSHRIPVRGSMILAQDNNLRLNYYLTIKFLYDMRSRIVHGDTDDIFFPDNKHYNAITSLGYSLSDKPWEYRYQIVDMTRKLTQQILMFFILHPKNLDRDWLLNLDLGLVNLHGE
jgi:hypothetical protein